MELWNRAMEAIEDGLDGELDVRELARLALTSEYHFRRVFSVLAGMPLSEYVRRRRLTVAAAAVVEGREAVQDVAVRFGYTSADAFARAFRAVHGIGPEQARRPGAVLRAQPRLAFHLRVEGSSAVQYRIVRKDAFRLAGRKARVPLVYEGINPAIAEFERSIPDEVRERIDALSDQEPAGSLAVCDAFEDEDRPEGTMLDYYAAAATSGPAPEDLDVLEVAAGTWAVFTADGAFPESVQQLWPQAYGEWLPANPYRVVPGPEIVRSEWDDDGEHVRTELWIAVEPTS